jgi:NTP pyrophosphatase (non-canonical NTP hydrolase)
MNQSMNESQVIGTRPDWNQLAEEMHQNAVDHGWYEPAPSMTSVLTNIHGELSEAWEAYRDHRPMIYSGCAIGLACSDATFSELACPECTIDAADASDSCKHATGKPEGIAIELADVVIRMLDICGHEQLDIATAMEQTPALMNSYARTFLRQENANKSFADLLAYLHEVVSCAHVEYRVTPDKADRNTESYFAECILLISDYIARNSNTTLAECIRLKHAYNRTRPYRHGGKVV